MFIKRGILFIAIAVALLSVVPEVAYAEWTWTPQTGRWINVKRLPKETAELQLEHARTLMLEGEHKKAMQETEKFFDYYDDTEFAADNQFLRGEIRMAQGRPLDAAKEFQQVVVNHSGSPLYDKVIRMQYEIGDDLYAQGEHGGRWYWPFASKRPYKHAGEVYSMVIANQPFTEAAAEAQYKLGLSRHTRKQYMEASFEYLRVIEDYPNSRWVTDAAAGLAEAYYDSSLDPDYDQQPSRLTIRAIEAFEERFPSDPRNAELGEMKHEMRESIAQQRLKTAQFYERRRNFDSARIYYEIVANEFKGTSSAEKANEWLIKNQEPARLADRIIGRESAS